VSPGPSTPPIRIRPLPEFHGAVLFEEEAVREMCRFACRGYETRQKRETFGFMYGTLTRDQRLVARRAVYYRGGRKTRSGVVFKDWATIVRIGLRRQELARRLRLRFLGNFHSHVEIAGEVFRGLSDEDRASFGWDPMSVLEAIVFVWPGTARRPARLSGSIVGFEPATGYNYRVRVYAKRLGRVFQARTRVLPSRTVIVF